MNRSALQRKFLRIEQNLGWELAIFLVALGAGVTVAFAIQDATYEDTHSLTGFITLTSRFTALLGTYLALVSLLMIARIPWVEKSIGYDKLVAKHRRLGPVVLSLIAIHIFSVVLAYSMTDQKSFVEELSALIFDYEWMMQALVAALLMLFVAVSSAKNFRKKLKYEHWWLIHLCSYLAISLAFMHQILTGSLFIFNEIARDWWIGLYIYTAFTIVMWRFLLPLGRSWRHKLIVDHLVAENNEVVSIYIRGKNLHQLHARGGNFFGWRFLSKGIWSQSHPYSLSSSPTQSMLRITVKNLGDHSLALSKLKAGTRVIIEGPYGVMTARRAIGTKIVLVAGGVGITPLRALLQEFSHDCQVDLIYRVVHEEEIILKSELEELNQSDSIRIHYLVGPPEKYPMGPAELTNLIPHIKECDIFVCGPTGLASLVRSSAKSLGISDSKFHDEAFAFQAN